LSMIILICIESNVRFLVLPRPVISCRHCVQF
jgi:hypothetical protein